MMKENSSIIIFLSCLFVLVSSPPLIQMVRSMMKMGGAGEVAA